MKYVIGRSLNDIVSITPTDGPKSPAAFDSIIDAQRLRNTIWPEARIWKYTKIRKPKSKYYEVSE